MSSQIAYYSCVFVFIAFLIGFPIFVIGTYNTDNQGKVSFISISGGTTTISYVSNANYDICHNEYIPYGLTIGDTIRVIHKAWTWPYTCQITILSGQ